jgi:hypothetical protein
VLGDHPQFSALRAFYSSYPEVRSHDRRASRALLAKGALKLLLGVTPFGLPTFIAQAMWKRRDVNRRLEAADVDWRVPARDAIKYGLFQPVNDILLAVQSLQMTGL